MPGTSDRGPPVGDGQSVLLVSDFTLTNLARLLEQPGPGGPIRPREGMFGSVVPTLLQADEDAAEEAALVWTRPQAVLSCFADVLAHIPVSRETIEEQVDEYAGILLRAAAKYRFMMVPTWVAPESNRGLGTLDLTSDAGVGRGLLHANARLMDRLHDASNMFLLDASRWISRQPDPGAAGRLWYLAKMPFSREVLAEAAADVRAAVNAVRGDVRKLVIIDLDNTIWGGVVGDVGWESLRLGGHDPIGEAFVDFQRAVKTLINRGIILGIVSKNEESVALQAIRKHKEMVLREDDFAGWRINWDDKAKNVVALTEELNLGLQSVVFIDDHPAERARVREALPDVYVPEWPIDPMRYASELRGLRCFDTTTLSGEDTARAMMYATERSRRVTRTVDLSPEEWVKSLDIHVLAERLTPGNLPRASQLLNKTNQMNLTTRRMTEGELSEWATVEGRCFWTFKVEDRFGDYGLTGLVSVEATPDAARIIDFVLSCRVFGRLIEETMIHVASDWARGKGCQLLTARYLETPKNKPCFEFFSVRSGFTPEPNGVFTVDTTQAIPMPESVTLERGEGGA